MSKTETYEEFIKRGGQVKQGPKTEYKGSGYTRYKMHEVNPPKPEKIPAHYRNAIKRKRKP